jgi:hypothetical protein
MTNHKPFPVGKELKKEYTAHVSVNMSRKMADALTVAAERHGMSHGAFLRLIVVWALDTNPGPVTDAEERWIDDIRGKKYHQAQFFVTPFTLEFLDALARHHEVTRAHLVRIIISRYLSRNPATRPLRVGTHATGGKPDTGRGATKRAAQRRTRME